MRMWMVDPGVMCREHLLGEHRELHMIAGTVENHNNGKQVLTGLAETGVIDLSQVKRRHDELAREMKRRDYDHDSPLDAVEGDYGSVDKQQSRDDLADRCKACRHAMRKGEA